MKIVLLKKPVKSKRSVYRASTLFIMLLVFGLQSYTWASEGKELPHVDVPVMESVETNESLASTDDMSDSNTEDTEEPEDQAEEDIQEPENDTEEDIQEPDESLQMTSFEMVPFGGAGESGGEKPPAEKEAPPAIVVPEYEIPEGSAYIVGSEETVYKNTAAQNAIQQAVEAAKANATKNVTIIVNNGVYNGGINGVVPAPEEGDTKLILRIMASDAYTKDKETEVITANTKSAGGVDVKGDLNFDGMDILLAGIYLSLKNKINVSNADEMTYYGTTQDDEVTINLDNVKEKVTIHSGDGNDTLDISLKKSPTTSVVLTKGVGLDENGDLSITGKTQIDAAIDEALELAGSDDLDSLEVLIDGGNGDDEITITLVNSIDIKPTGGYEEGSLSGGLKVDMDLSATDLTVNGGAGADAITVKGGSGHGIATVISGPTQQKVMDKVAIKGDLPSTEIKINGGAGDDLVNIDTTTAFSSFRKVNVTADGGTGYDRVNLTGKLEKYEDNNHNLSGDANEVEMAALAEISILNETASISKLIKSLLAKMGNIAAVTDELANKRTVTIDDLSSSEIAFEHFTNYVIDANSETINYTNNSGFEDAGETKDTFLTNLIINGSDVSVGNVIAPHVNILISSMDNGLNQSGNVNVTGQVEGKNISIKVKNTDSHALEIISNDLTDDEDDYSLEASFFDIVSDAAINIGNTGKLIATQTVNLEAISEQTKPLIPTLEELTGKFGDQYAQMLNINFVGVKVGSASINIEGTIQAAAIRALAKSLVKVSATNANLADFGMPLAVGVVVSKAAITASGDAKMNASEGGIFLKAKSDVALETNAVSGLLPFTLAVSAVVNDAAVDIKGNTELNAKGDIAASASGWTNLETSASGPKEPEEAKEGEPAPKEAGKSGGFFAVSVAIQNVFASITENASAHSEGDLRLKSTSHERVINKATSSPDDGGTSFTLSNLIDKIKGLFTTSADKKDEDNADKGTEDNRASSALKSIVSKITGSKPEEGTGPGQEVTPPKETSTGVTDLVNTGTAGSTPAGNDKNTSSTQLVGALAVTYAENTNKAFIDTTGTIKAGGDLAVHAIGSIANETLADGSPIKRTSAGATGVVNPGPAAPVEKTYKGYKEGQVVFEGTKNGFLEIDKKEIEQTLNTKIIITPTVSDGYKLESITMNGVLLKQIAGEYSFKILDINDIILAATFVPKEYTITSSNVNAGAGTFYTNPIYGDEGDSIIVHVTPNESYTVKEVLVTYTGTDGKKVTLPNQPVTGETNQYRFTMPKANVTVTVEFDGKEQKLNLSPIIENGTIIVKDASGTIILSNGATEPISTSQVQVGTVLTVEVTPAAGHRLQANGLSIGEKTILPTADGIYKFTMPADTTSLDGITLLALFEVGDPTASTTGRTGSIALGVGVAVAVVNYTNQAYINAATDLEAKSIDILAKSTDISSSTISRAGFTEADLGLAGALTVHVMTAKNAAELNEDISIDGGSVNIKADVLKSNLLTVADAAGTEEKKKAPKETAPKEAEPKEKATEESPSSDSVGIGAGIAVGVIGVDTFAKVADDVCITAKNNVDLDSMNITASYVGVEKMIAKAGAAGGTAVVPVLALDISGIYVAADTGNSIIAPKITFTGDINIIATNKITRDVSADAAAAGGSVGVGGSFIVAILNDSASSNLGRSVKGKKVNVKADSISRLKANGKAGAAGSTSKTTTSGNEKEPGGGSSGGSGGKDKTSDSDPEPEPPGSSDPEEDDYSDDLAALFDEGEADAIADANTESATKMADVAGTKNVSGTSVSTLTADRQKAETSEGSVQVAATFTLNIQKNISKATIGNGITVESEGPINVISKNDTDAIIKSDASATNATTGVGVAVAINIVTYENIASVGDAILIGESLKVTAEIYEKAAKDMLPGLLEELLKKLEVEGLANSVLTSLER